MNHTPASPAKHRPSVARCAWHLGWLACLALGACQSRQPPSPVAPPPAAAPSDSALAPRESDEQHVARALEFMQQRDTFNLQGASDQTQYHLNRWAQDQQQSPDWIVDPLVNSMSREYREIPPVRQLADLSFSASDVLFLEEALWLHDLSQWISRESLGPLWAHWIQATCQDWPRADGEDLELACRLFDWTIRNVQLDGLLPEPQRLAAGPQDMAAHDPRAPSYAYLPATQGVPGPGYTHFPWHVLLYGHGDAWERARVFILLARQQKLNVVMLGVDQGGGTNRVRPWVAAAWIHHQLVLFDPELGLPVLAPQRAGLATLAQVQADPQSLRQLDTSERPYPVQSADLERLVVMVDASPEYLAQRMSLLQQQLPANANWVLTTQPTALARQLREVAGMPPIRLWTIPFDAILFQKGRLAARQRNPAGDAAMALEELVFAGQTPLAQARRQHFHGVFDTQSDAKGAKELYMASRLSDDTLDRMMRSPDLQTKMGMTRGPAEDDQTWQQRLAMTRILCTRAKQHASYWLGLVQFDEGRYDLAVNWLQRRTLEATPESPWKNGAAYNLGRSYERLGKWDDARRLYLRDESPQRAGNVLRARWLVDIAPSRPPSDAGSGK